MSSDGAYSFFAAFASSYLTTYHVQHGILQIGDVSFGGAGEKRGGLNSSYPHQMLVAVEACYSRGAPFLF